MTKKIVYLYCDGACRGNPGPGGWGVVLRYQTSEKLISGAQQNTTNNRMELTAALEGLKALKKPCHIELTTDSQYLRRGITEWLPKWETNNWKTSQKKAVKNQDLWVALAKETKRHQINWHWVKSHSGHPENETADALANQAIEQIIE